MSCPLGHEKASPGGSDDSMLNALNFIPTGILNENYLKEGNFPPGISHERIQSSIPRTPSTENASACPIPHATTAPIVSGESGQADTNFSLKNRMQPPSSATKELSYWQYPSPAMFWKAIEKKHADSMAMETLQAHPLDIHAVVHLHNIVNERVWQEIKFWERLLHAKAYHNPTPPSQGPFNSDSSTPSFTTELSPAPSTFFSFPTLTRFIGRPDEYSPKALFMHHVLGYALPFDRHDWYINRNGETVRYVVDFYAGKAATASPTTSGTPNIMHSEVPVEPAASFYIDVRPAATPSGLWDRLKMFFYSKAQSTAYE
jgi:cytochrome c heme-lyase